MDRSATISLGVDAALIEGARQKGLDLSALIERALRRELSAGVLGMSKLDRWTAENEQDVGPTNHLHPQVNIDGITHRLAIEKITTVRSNDIAPVVCSLIEHECPVSRAIDFLSIGI